MRLGLVAGAIATLLCAGACAPAPPVPTAPDLTPVPGAVQPAATASFAPPSIDTITSAIDALDALGSYRFIEARGVPAVQTQGVVINGEPHRVRTDTMSGDAVSMSLIQIGSRSWISVAGSGYRSDDLGLGGPDDPIGMPVAEGDTWVGPVAGDLASLVSGLDAVTELGVELHNGVPARHLRAAGTGEVKADANGDPIGDGFSGTVEAWIAVDGGYLTGLRAVGTYAGAPVDEGDPSAAPEPYRLEATIEGANDPANRVDEPVTPDPTVMPSGDPAIVALLEGIDDGLAGLTAYQGTLTSGADDAAMTVTLTVVNRPVEALRLDTRGVPGTEAVGSILVGGKAWTRQGDAPWIEDDAGGLAGMCQAGASGRLAACVIDSVVGLDGLNGVAGAFAVVDADEPVGGIATTHLHSSSGLPSAGDSLPGDTDLWIANDGGYLVRYAFEGQGLTVAFEVGRVNDPTIVIEAPGAGAAGPSGPTGSGVSPAPAAP